MFCWSCSLQSLLLLSKVCFVLISPPSIVTKRVITLFLLCCLLLDTEKCTKCAPLPTPPNARHPKLHCDEKSCKDGHPIPGAVATFSCHHNFTATVDPLTLTCLADGSWKINGACDPESCTAGGCGNYTTCHHSKHCACALTVEGESFCGAVRVNDSSMASLSEEVDLQCHNCTDSSDCPEGSRYSALVVCLCSA